MPQIDALIFIVYEYGTLFSVETTVLSTHPPGPVFKRKFLGSNIDVYHI